MLAICNVTFFLFFIFTKKNINIQSKVTYILELGKNNDEINKIKLINMIITFHYCNSQVITHAQR